MGRAYKPDRIIKSSGIHTFYIGKPEDPVIQAFEAYCIHTEQTFSESCRDMIVIALVHLGFLEDPGIDDGIFLQVGEGKFTPKYYAFRRRAEDARRKQLQRLEQEREEKEKEQKQKEKKAKVRVQTKAKEAETAFD
jgi:hypothetical protein